MEKAEIRKQALKRRDNLSALDRELKSSSIAEHFSDLAQQVQLTGPIGAYLPIRSEVDTQPLLQKLRENDTDNRVTALPVVVDRETIIFRTWGVGDPIEIAGFGTMGPRDDAPIVDPRVLIMPLSAFDATGNRLGYGAGHYDRAISRLLEKDIQPILIGVAFAVQEEPTIPVEAHDKKLHYIVTENGWRQLEARV